MSALKEIQDRAAAASPGPWMWRGNVDNDDPALSRYEPGSGRVEVLRQYPRARTLDDRGARAYDEYLHDSQVWDQTLKGGAGDYRSYTDEERAERVREDWLTDRWGSPVRENRLAFADPEHHMAVGARELAIFEVCPEATDRSDHRVYRADVIGIRHPDAEFIAHSRQDVDDLLAIIATIRDRAESWYDDLENLTDEECIAGAGCPCCHARDILSLVGDDRPAVRPMVTVETVQAAGEVL